MSPDSAGHCAEARRFRGAGVFDIGADNLSPFPTPLDDSRLITTGIYGELDQMKLIQRLKTISCLMLLLYSVVSGIRFSANNGGHCQVISSQCGHDMLLLG